METVGDQSKEPLTKFVEGPNTHLLCPVCRKIYREPVISRCGHTFCRQCAFSSSHCPVDNVHCDTTQLVVNRLVVGQVEDLKIHCCYGILQKHGDTIVDPSGCPETISFGNRKEHEDTCQYAFVPCPNSMKCGSLRQREVEGHMSQCTFTPCSYKEKGCEFVGTRSQVDQHVKTCSSKGQQSELGCLQKSNAELNAQVLTLTLRVEELEQFKSRATSQLEVLTGTISNLQQQCERLSTHLQQLSSNTHPHRRSLCNSTTSLQEIPGTPSRSSAGSTSPTGTEKWEMPFQFKCIGTLRGHQDVVWCLTAYRGRLYSAGNDMIVKVWDLDHLAKGCIGNYRGHTGRVHCMAKRSNMLYTGGADSSIRVWNTERAAQTDVVEGAHDNIICAMAITGDYLFTSSYALIKVWDIKTLSLVHSFTALDHWVRALAVSPAKDKLYSGSHNAIHLWETSRSFQSLGIISHEGGSVHSLAVNKLFIIAGSINQNVQVFSATTHQFVMNLSNHLGTVCALVLSLSGRFLFSASQDKSISVWNMETMLPIQVLSRHQGAVNALAICGNLVLSGSEDHEIKVFRYFPQ